MSVTTILVTGGTGHLGRDLVQNLKLAGHRLRLLARRPGTDVDVDWVKGDLSAGDGLSEAVRGVELVLHAATNSPIARRGGFRPTDLFQTPSDVDLEGTRRLIAAAKGAGIERFTHISIVGIDQAKYPYAEVKFAGETLVRESGLSWSVIRGTPFYYLIDGFFGGLRGLPVWMLPTRLPFQPCDSRDFAKYIAECVTDGVTGDRREFGGPEVLSLGEVARQYQGVRGFHRPIVHLPLGPLANRFKPMFPAAAPDAVRGTTTWTIWLRDRPAEPPAGSPRTASHKMTGSDPDDLSSPEAALIA